MRRPLSLLPLFLLGACAGGDRPGEPSLAPRAAEAIDPRLPVPDTSGELPANAALAARLQSLLAEAQAAQGGADAAIAAAERAAAGAGPRQSESWIAAQQLLSAAVAARYPVVRALGDMDALVARAVQEGGGLVPADLQAVRAAASAVAAIDSRQAARIAAVQARLG